MHPEPALTLPPDVSANQYHYGLVSARQFAQADHHVHVVRVGTRVVVGH